MTSNQAISDKKLTQVSLPAEFARFVRAHADVGDRSMEAQLEHWAKVGLAIETVFPSKDLGDLKNGHDAGEIISRIGAFLVSQQPLALIEKLDASGSPRYGVEVRDPEVAIRINPDGSSARGRFDAEGVFKTTALTRRESNDQTTQF